MNAVKVYFTHYSMHLFPDYVNDFQCIVTICNLFYIFCLLQHNKKDTLTGVFFVKL